jgi:lipopolysaccharide transport system permease protein
LLIVVIGISLSVGLLNGKSALEQSPRIAVAMGFWTFISGVLTEATEAFTADRSILLNTTLSEKIMTIRLVWRNYLVLAHNASVMVLCLIFTGSKPQDFFKLFVLIAVFGPIIAVVIYVPAFFFSRFSVLNKDLKVFLSTAVQLNFFLTPIFWDPPSNGTMRIVFLVNPAGWVVQFSKEFMFTDRFPFALMIAISAALIFFYGAYFIVARKLQPLKKFL